MRQTQNIMGMHVTVDIKDAKEDNDHGFKIVFDYLHYIDKKFSTYKPDSEISKINRGEILKIDYSDDMKEILKLAEQTKQQTNQYFNIKKPDGTLDPSGVVKGWAIWQAAQLLKQAGNKYLFIDVGGDIQAHVANESTQNWKVGIKNPFNLDKIVKVLKIANQGVATSGTYERGDHIYNPHSPTQKLNEILSITVIGENIFEADRFATAAFAMGRQGIHFIESLPKLEAYMIDNQGIATMTTGLEQFTVA
jgi:thiamine biosynthesis lipoprotein